MKKMLLISGVMLALTATVALAGGLDFSWGPACAADGLIINKTYACTSNAGSDVMVASFSPTADNALFLACDAVIDGQVAAGNPVIPNWWQFKNTGACRLSGMSPSAAPPAGGTLCEDAWLGQATATIDYYGDPILVSIPVPPVQGPRVRIKVGVSLPAAAGNGVVGGAQYFAFALAVNHTKTVGTGACAGCLVPMTFVFNSIMPGYSDGMDPPVLSSEVISTPIHNQCITWQGGILCGETPTQNKTWGQVKSLYR